ncbi:MAG: Obg family GTPase CgtA [candidate division KSB1 bacterium]|nr:Obg family GTPase CgtA [candidate division KSB1 bacterium]
MPEFEKDGFSFSVYPAASAALDSAFLRSPNLLQKIRWFLAQIFGRLGQIPKLRRYDCVYLHRETLPYFFPFTELLLRRLARRLIFDFDDAVFYYPKRASRLKQLLMDRHSANRIITAADRVIVSTPYLAEHARRFNKQVICIPTGVRFADYKDVKPQKERVFSYEPSFIVEKIGEKFIVKGKKVEDLVKMTDLTSEESVKRLQKILKKLGVEKKLKEVGVKEGDIVVIGDVEFTYFVD